MKIFLFLSLLIIISLSNCTLLFKIKNTEEQCLGGEFFESSVVVVKYKAFTQSRKPLTKVLPYMLLYLKKVDNSQIFDEKHIITNKGKFTFDIKEGGLYDICMRVKKMSVVNELKEDLFVNLKINPDYYFDEEALFSNAINTKDVDTLSQKAKHVITLTKPILDNQKNQMDIEREYSLKTLSNANHYKYLTYCQLLIIIIIGMIQINNFRRFLKSQNVI